MTTTAEPAVYVIDDDDAVRDSLLFLLEVDGLSARGFASVEAFLAAPPRQAGGCIVSDMRMPGLDGADLLRLLPEHGVRLPVIVITGHGDVAAAVRVLGSGAFDFIEKPFQDVTILQTVRDALAVGRPDPTRDARVRATRSSIAHLSEQEQGILDRLVQGDANSRIAVAQGMELSDVELARARILRRVGAASVSELVRLVTQARRYPDQASGSR